MSRTPINSASDASDGRVLFRPLEMDSVGHHHRRGAESIRLRLRRLRLATATTGVNLADPGLHPSLPARQQRIIVDLGRSAEALAKAADQLAVTAADAVGADAGSSTPAICRAGDGALIKADRRLTEVAGDGLALGARQMVRSAHGVTSLFGRRPTSGDPGGTYSARPVPDGWFESVTARGVSDPRRPAAGTTDLISAALGATADQSILAHDEFGLIKHDADRYTVVLPGVVDLTRPEAGWSQGHRSVRDLDMAAIPASISPLGGGADNAYATMVARALSVNDVPAGAELMLVGHSFGAATALDLAADQAFTADYRVTHVVATGYDAESRLSLIEPSTRVLVVQNRSDAVVGVGSLLPPGGGDGVLGCLPAARTESSSSPSTTVIRFDGGLDGFGHAASVYQSPFTGDVTLPPDDEDRLHDFIASAAAHRFESPGSMTAIDVSVPAS